MTPVARIGAWCATISAILVVIGGVAGGVKWYHETDLSSDRQNAKEDSIEDLAERLTITYLAECDGAKRSAFTHNKTVQRLARFSRLAERDYIPPPCWRPPDVE